MQTIISTVVSLSGRLSGVFILSDDPNIIRNSLAITEAFKKATEGRKE